MGLTASNDVLSESEEVVVKIKELPEKYGIDLSEEALREYGEQAISKAQIEALRIKDTAGEKLDTLKSLFGLKAEIDTSGIKKGAEQLYSALKMGEIESKKGVESLGNLGDNIDKALGKTEISQKVKEATIKAKKVAEEVGVSKGFDYIIDKLKSFGGWFGQLLAGIFGFFKGLIGMGNKAEKAKNIAKKALQPEEIEKAKQKALIIIEDNLGEYLTPKNKKTLKNRLSNLTNDQLLQINEKIKKGTLSISDIKSIAPNIIEGFLSPEQIQKLKEQFSEKLIISLGKGIKEKYNIDISGEKQLALEKLVKENTTIGDDNIETMLRIQRNKQILVSDMFGPSFETILNITNITFGLLTKGIVPLSAFGLDFVHSSTDIIVLSLKSLGIGEHIKLDSLNKRIEDMGEDEKALFIALLYRKGGILFSIVGSIMGSITKFGIEASTSTNVKSFDLLKNSTLGKYDKQIGNLNKLESALGINEKASSELLVYKKQIESIAGNYKKLQILKESKGNFKEAKRLFNNAQISIKSTTFEDLLKEFRDNSIKISNVLGEKGSISSRMGFGKNADLFRLSTRLEKIATAQRYMFSSNYISKVYGQVKDALNIGELSRDIDKVSFHYDSLDEAKKGLSKWNILANKSPELVKGLFDKFPIVVIAGLAANSEEGFLEEFSKNIEYLLPVVGSILLIKDSGLNWSNGSIETIDPLNAGIGAALLTVDSIFITKEWIKGGAFGAGKYIIKPISDLYSIARGSFEGVSYLGKTIGSGKSISSILEKSKGLTKGLPKIIPKKLKGILAILAIGYFGIEYAMVDETLNHLFDKNGKLDEGKLKEYMLSGEVNDDEKIVLIKYLIFEEWGESYIDGLDFSIKNNKVNIISNNPIVKTKSIIKVRMLELLGLNNNLQFKYIG